MKPDISSTSDQSVRARRWRLGYTFLLGALALIGGAWIYRWVSEPPVIERGGTASDRVVVGSFLGGSELDRLIGEYRERTEEHTDSSDFRILGSLLMEKARMTGDISSYLAAKAAFDRAVELYPGDPVARVGAASAAYALHDFSQAAELAGPVYEATRRADALAVLFDARLALGDYEAARSLLSELVEVATESPAVMVRQAEWERLTGDADAAKALSLDALAASEDSANPRLRSWYEAFAAQMMLELGDYPESLDLARQAFDHDPESRTARVALARAHSAEGDLRAAIELYEKLAADVPEPEIVSELATLYELTNQPEAAEDADATLRVTAQLAESQGVYGRAIAHHLADRRIDPQRAVEMARSELEARQDVGAYDTLAWALFAADRLDEATEAAESALALGTVDAEYHYHAGMIAAARGDSSEAITHLDTALSISPQFDPRQADEARSTLERLR